MSTRSDLEKAADVIQVHGWKRGPGGSGSVGFCIHDALARVIKKGDGGSRHAHTRMDAALGVLKAEIDPSRAGGTRTVWHYNDHDAQSAEEVIGMIRRVARNQMTEMVE